MTGNKDRVYIALYFRSYITSNPQLVQQYGTAAYHWAIIVESKDGNTKYAFDVKEDDAYPQQGIIGGWTYHKSYNVRPNRSLIWKSMIGKLPSNISHHDVGNLLNTKNIPLPLYNTSPIQNCVTWTKEAIAILQRNHYAETFDIDHFVNLAVEDAAEAYAAHPRLDAITTSNHTNRPM
jgi:hypothetical protein